MARKIKFKLPLTFNVIEGEGENAKLSADLVVEFAKRKVELNRIEVTPVPPESFDIREVDNGYHFQLTANKSKGEWIIYDLNARSSRRKSILFTASESEQEFLSDVKDQLKRYGMTRDQISEASKEALRSMRDVEEKIQNEVIYGLVGQAMAKSLARKYKRSEDEILDVEYKVLPAPKKTKKGR